MDKRIYLNDLYDIYKELLNDTQRICFEYYYFDNLSLGEISENMEVSRNAIHKQLKIVEMKLEEYESKLRLFEKSKKLDNIIKSLEDEALKNKLNELR